MSVSKRVLVVEDNELNLKLFCDLLKVHGHETAAVRDGREAFAQAKAIQPDLIITDIQMPHVTGLDLIASFRADATLAAVPIMAVTAYAGLGDEERIRAAGASAYVSKPISVLKFMEVVNGLLTQPTVSI
jgi:two-component system cell cycle response regulator DivK